MYFLTKLLPHEAIVMLLDTMRLQWVFFAFCRDGHTIIIEDWALVTSLALWGGSDWEKELQLWRMVRLILC